MHIDQSAPLVGHGDIFIHASLNTVWHLQTTINYWTVWQHAISEAQLDGKLAVGTLFYWRMALVSTTSRIDELETWRRIGWTSDSMGMHSIHNWEFEKREGGTRVKTEESISGWVAQTIGFLLPSYAEAALDRSLQMLKQAAERR